MGAVGKYLPNPRLIELDVLRTAAVLLVLIRHIQILYPGDHTLVGRILEAFQRAGWIGVDLFFVLSGFLVSGLLFKEFQRFGEIKIISFLIRRALKIYPAF
ncbi:MAG: acyltransferase family protein, partial [Bdellovibrionota bacterium]